MKTLTSLIGAELAVAIRILVALIFLAAALGKMRHWLAFQGVLANYRLLPENLIAPLSYLLPPTEAVLAVWLAADFRSAGGPLAAAVLLLVFAAAMGINLRRGRRFIDCGCFQSTLKQTLSWRLVGRNVVLALLASFAAVAAPDRGDAWLTFAGVLAGALLFVLLNALNILWSIVPAWRAPASRGAVDLDAVRAGGQA
jgi:hypothetical protein